MAISKRLRYEILRRDNHACRYCGAAAPEVKLTIDHVVPSALGGTDVPENLVTACQPCNSGKSASSPDSPIVADVRADAIRWAAAMREAASLRLTQLEALREYTEVVDRVWSDWRTGGGEGEPLGRPLDWERSVEQFFSHRVAFEEWRYAIKRAMQNPRVAGDEVWTYMCGIMWSRLREQTEIAQALASKADGEDT